MRRERERMRETDRESEKEREREREREKEREMINFRPIFNVSILSKLLERIVASRLNAFIST